MSDWPGIADRRVLVAGAGGIDVARAAAESKRGGLYRLAHADHAPYAASKGGPGQLIRVMAREWASSGVAFDVIASGYVDTGLTREHLDPPGVRNHYTALATPNGWDGPGPHRIGPVPRDASPQQPSRENTHD